MKKEVAQAKIRKAVNQVLQNESQAVKDYFCDLIFLMFLSLENDGDVNDNGKPYTSTENLIFALNVDLYDNLAENLEEARKETGET